ncbi:MULTISPECIES: hypothetical protein [Arthrobacter]|uniref:hypothetical protein n=1 Tax=Arthrobacter TaxID=1663 RepID=UPI001264F351|nr:hypothetical protein [Arthrobacter citreus]
MPFYKLPSAGLKPAASPPRGQDTARARHAGVPAGAALASYRAAPSRRRAAPSRRQVAAGLLRLLLRAVAVRAAASGRLVDEQEQRQLHLLRLSAPASVHGR